MNRESCDRKRGLLHRLSRQKHLYAVKDGLTLLTPLFIFISILLTLARLPIPAYRESIATLAGLTWPELNGIIYDVCLFAAGAAVAVSVSASLISWYRQHRTPETPAAQIPMISAICYTMMNYSPRANEYSASIFLAVATSLAATELFYFLKLRVCPIPNLLVNEPNNRVRQVFSVLPCTLMTLLLFGLIRLAQSLAGLPSLGELMAGLSFAQMSYLPAVLLSHLMWLFGLHAGSAPIGPNAALCLILAVLLYHRRTGEERLARIGLLPSVFNANELCIYGLPVAFNPAYAIPFLAAPLCMAGAALLTGSGGTAGQADWTLWGFSGARPFWLQALAKAFCLAIGTAVFLPFVKASARQSDINSGDAMERLRALCGDEEESGGALLSRDDEIGALARQLAGDLKRALDSGQGLYYLYQPLVDGRDRRVVGAEELLRWQHPTHGDIEPTVTVALAEELGLSRRLGRLAVITACETLRRWHENGLNDLYVSVNISAPELNQPDFAARLYEVAKRYEIRPDSLQLEITETLALSKDAATRDNLNLIREMGFGIAIDDFGRGHSSLLYLQKFPFSTLKVDKALSKGVLQSPGHLEIISSLTQLCRTLGVGMVVEHVENGEQLSLLQSVGCQFFQGYHFGEPVPSEQFINGFAVG